MMITRLLLRLRRDRRAISAVEGALATPVVLLALSVGYDMTSYATAQMRMREVAFRIADFAAADDGLGINGKLTDVAEVYSAARDMMVPYKACALTSIVLSAVSNADGNRATIVWQEKWEYPVKDGSADCPGKAAPSVVSGLGTVGAVPDFAAVLPNQAVNAMLVKPKDAVIVAEVVFRDVTSVLPDVLAGLLPRSHYGSGAARVRGQMN
jgi:hypothetical protein